MAPMGADGRAEMGIDVVACKHCLWDIRKHPDGEWHLAYLIGDEVDDPACEHEPYFEDAHWTAGFNAGFERGYAVGVEEATEAQIAQLKIQRT